MCPTSLSFMYVTVKFITYKRLVGYDIIIFCSSFFINPLEDDLDFPISTVLTFLIRIKSHFRNCFCLNQSFLEWEGISSHLTVWSIQVILFEYDYELKLKYGFRITRSDLAI